MDPRIQSILAEYEHKGEEKDEEKESEEKILPRTADEWLVKLGYTVWPIQIEEEKSLNLTPEDVGTGSLEDIMKDLAAHAPLDISVMDDVLKQIEELEQKLHKYASRILNIQVTKPTVDGEEPVSEARDKTPPLVRRYRRDEETVRETIRKAQEGEVYSHKEKSVENTTYFGFMPNELTPLPGQLESQQLLNRITQTQKFPQPYNVVWRKTILSEASVAVFQDAFWWFFCRNFERNQSTDAIFSRISDSFVALFFSIPPGYKDWFFEHYPNCVAQALYAAFCEAFPDSFKLFGDDFKSSLLDTVCEWVWGIKPPPLSWRNWPMQHLEPGGIRESQKNVKSLQRNLSFDLDSILGEECPLTPSEKSKAWKSPSQLFQLEQNNGPESHPVGAGPEFKRVQFNILGQSPLVSHFLSVKGLRSADIEMVKKTVKRTEIAQLPAPSPTYRDLINNCKKNSRMMSQQYCLLLQMSAEESQRIQKQKHEVLARINQLQDELTKKHSDFMILSEKIYDVVCHSDYIHPCRLFKKNDKKHG